MKRDFLSVVRLVLPVVFTCVVLAIAIKIFGAPSSTPAWAALHESPASPYRNVIVVARSGGDFAAVQKALNSITDNSPTNRYLVWVAPGTYTETVTMKQYVDIEGAGEMVTRIVSAGGANSATLFGASNAELRYLTVESTASPAYATAIWNANASPSLLHVTAISSLPTSDGTSNMSDSSPDIWLAYGIRNTSSSSPIMMDVTVSTTVGLNALGYGMYNDSSSPMMKNVKVSISGGNIGNYGMYNNNSSPTMEDVTISSSGGTGNVGVYNNNSSSTMKDVTISSSRGPGVGNYGSGNFSVTIDDSTISAPNGSTIYNSPSYVTRVGASKLEGGPVSGSPVTCAGVYDENYIFYPNTCP
jgi:hypothetical protein